MGITEFKRRARNSSTERKRQQQSKARCVGDTEPRAKRSIPVELGDGSGNGEHTYNSGEALSSLLAAVATRVYKNALLEDVLDFARPTPAGLCQQCSKRLGAGYRAWLKTASPRSQALGPGVQGAVGRYPLAMQHDPGHRAQTPVALGVGRTLELDYVQPVGLLRQDIARQHPKATFARRTARKGYEDCQLDRAPLAMAISLEHDQTALNPGRTQHQRRRPLTWTAFSIGKLKTAFPKQVLVGTVWLINRDRHDLSMSMAVERR